MLGGLAEFERELRQWPTGSSSAARASSTRTSGGKPRIAKGETYTAIARTYAVDPNTISRLAQAGA